MEADLEVHLWRCGRPDLDSSALSDNASSHQERTKLEEARYQAGAVEKEEKFFVPKKICPSDMCSFSFSFNEKEALLKV